MGGACEKKKPNDTGAITAMDRAGSAAEGGATTTAAAGDSTPLPGIDVTHLDADKQKLFYTLVNSLKSPCGKAHSLRTSFTSDTSCKRAPYAVKYLAALLDEELSEIDVREFFTNKYEKASPAVKFDVTKAPKLGVDDAPIRLVEFFDYECPHCMRFKPILDQVIGKRGKQIVLYFMMYPIHKESLSAAQAGLAAAQQGKFHEMHALLFERSPVHDKTAVMSYAAELGLDPQRFEAAYQAAEAQVTSDAAQGKAAGVDSTPTMFFNDHRYEGPMSPKFIEMWIDEELAVNR